MCLPDPGWAIRADWPRRPSTRTFETLVTRLFRDSEPESDHVARRAPNETVNPSQQAETGRLKRRSQLVLFHQLKASACWRPPHQRVRTTSHCDPARLPTLRGPETVLGTVGALDNFLPGVSVANTPHPWFLQLVSFLGSRSTPPVKTTLAVCLSSRMLSRLRVGARRQLASGEALQDAAPSALSARRASLIGEAMRSQEALGVRGDVNDDRSEPGSEAPVAQAAGVEVVAEFFGVKTGDADYQRSPTRSEQR